jgi:hypothetical protein
MSSSCCYLLASVPVVQEKFAEIVAVKIYNRSSESKLLPSVCCEESKTTRLKILQFFYSLTSKVHVLDSKFFKKKSL